MFGPKEPFRNIEREFRKKKHEKEHHLKPPQQFIKVWVCMGEESDGAILTRTIEDI